MLCARIDINITQLVGRWRSDEMIKYLHVQADSIMRNYSRQMFEHGHFTYHGTDDVDNSETFLPSQAAPNNAARNITHPRHPDL